MPDSAVGSKISDVKKIDQTTLFKKTRLTIKKMLKNTKQSITKFGQKCQKWTGFEMHHEIIFFYAVD
jgi:hypothetical protein